jgi:hypothetical protein
MWSWNSGGRNGFWLNWLSGALSEDAYLALQLQCWFSLAFCWNSSLPRLSHDTVWQFCSPFTSHFGHGAHATDRLYMLSSPLHRHWRCHTRCPRWSSRRIWCQFCDQIRNLISSFFRQFLTLYFSLVLSFSSGRAFQMRCPSFAWELFSLIFYPFSSPFESPLHLIVAFNNFVTCSLLRDFGFRSQIGENMISVSSSACSLFQGHALNGSILRFSYHDGYPKLYITSLHWVSTRGFDHEKFAIKSHHFTRIFCRNRQSWASPLRRYSEERWESGISLIVRHGKSSVHFDNRMASQ